VVALAHSKAAGVVQKGILVVGRLTSGYTPKLVISAPQLPFAYVVSTKVHFDVLSASQLIPHFSSPVLEKRAICLKAVSTCNFTSVPSLGDLLSF